MAKKTAKAIAAKKQVKPAGKAGGSAKKATKPASSAKPKKPVKAASPAKRTAKPIAKSAKKVAAKPVKKVAKATVKPVITKKSVKPVKVAKVAVKPVKTKALSKPIAKVAAKLVKVSKPTNKKVVVPVSKVSASKAQKPAPVVAPVKSAIVKAAAKPEQKAENKHVEKPKLATPVADKVAAEKPDVVVKKEAVKTVEQQMQEKAQGTDEPAAKAGSKTKEELFVPKYQLPATVEVPRPMRPKPPVMDTNVQTRPVANPIYVPPAPDGKLGIKFAPIAVVERPKEKLNKSEEEDMSSKTSPRLAFTESDDKKGISVESKLRALYGIQLIDSRIDKIHAMRGELPLEVQDLEDDVVGLETRATNLTNELKNYVDEIVGKKNGIKNSEALIKKYKEQLNNVKNNREFDSLNKEIEFQELEIQLHTKRIKEYEASQKQKQDLLESAEQKLKERRNDLKVKRTELDDIITSTEKEEKILRKRSDEAKKLIEERLLSAYERIRSGAPNGMAVVPIEREASAGSFIQLPPQKQLDVAARKRVIVDEHSGRILVDADLAREEQEKMHDLLSKEH